MYCLQSRWKLEKDGLVYYGLRNKANLFKNKIRLSRRALEIIGALPKELTEDEKKVLAKVLNKQVVEEKDVRIIPKSLDEARFCTNCVANDFIIPGLEFDENGLCPMCQTIEETKDLRSVVPVKNTFPRSKRSRFDVALFYTGGKDSTYLLYYLSQVLSLRVLALTWEIPYMSENARQSINNAKKKLDNVEFITRYVSNNDLRAMYRHLYSVSDNVCACPSLAYVLFYSELVENKVPYFILGNEPVQMLGLYYNHMSPKFVYKMADNKTLNFLINVGRILTLRPPLRQGQFQTLTTMQFLAKGDNFFKRHSGLENEQTANVAKSIHKVPKMVAPLRRAIRRSSITGNIPAFVHVDLNEICGGKYDWREVKNVISKECGWVAPDDTDKGLHTSCKIEKCKEHSQFKRFYEMRSRMIPFSALEISLAGRDNNVSREQAILEIRKNLGFSLEEIEECKIMREYIDE